MVGAANTRVPGATPTATSSDAPPGTSGVAAATGSTPTNPTAAPLTPEMGIATVATTATPTATTPVAAATATPADSAPTPTLQTETLPAEAAPIEGAPTKTAPTEAANTTGAPTRLVIPALGIDAPVVEVPLQAGTWDMQALTFEIAHLGGTAYPGQGSNTVLAGHVTIIGGIGPFYHLEQLPDGAEIIVYVGDQAHAYTVASRERLLPTDVGIVQPGDGERLTLITCTTWDPLNRRYLERIALICTPAESPAA